MHGKISGWLECFPIENIGEPVPTYSLLLLLASLYLLESIGASKSTGKGYCRCEITKFMYNGNSCDEYKPWLDHLEMLSYYSDIAAQEEKV